MAGYMLGCINICRRAFGMERDEIERGSFAASSVVLSVYCVIQEQPKPVAAFK